MLRELHVRNFAVVEELELQFAPGMTVFTGETGAGKSILIDALGLLLGDRADAATIRGNCDSSEVAGSFDISGLPDLRALLDAQALNSGEGELLIRRVVGRDGRSRAFVNDSPVPAQLLRSVGEHLVDIHGQGEHQSLLKRDIQRMLLDEYGGHDTELAAVHDACTEWRDAARDLAALSAAGPDRDAQLTLLRYQVEELESGHIQADEFETLDGEHRRLANAARLLETLQRVAADLYENEHSSYAQFGRAARELQDMERFDDRLAGIRALLEAATIQLDEAVAELRDYLAGLELDPRRLIEVEQRLDALHDLARKHRVSPQQLAARFEELKLRLDAMENSSTHVQELQLKQARALECFAAGARALHSRRVNSAGRLAAALTKQVRDLGIPGAGFTIEVIEGNDDAPQMHGIDQVEFLVTLNPGQPARPLAKIASGGELSRISLAIQVIASSDRGTPTLIFDEVDAGIGGATAEIVGNLLHRLAQRRQIICVTHLPQVASQGDNHFQVEKSTSRNATRTRVLPLSAGDRIEEIARMLGGVKISAQTRAHAREMLGKQLATSDKQQGKRKTP